MSARLLIAVAILAWVSTEAVASPADEPGCVAAAMRDGEVLHVTVQGLADLSSGQRLEADSVFNVASVSKQFTAFSVLLLEQQKKLSLSDRVARWLPELQASAPDVTLDDLMHHISGLRDYETLLNLQGRRLTDGATQAETIALLARQRAANAPPGTEYVYSNSGYVLLASVVERVSGMPLSQFEQQNIFMPLGMTRTRIVDRYPLTMPNAARGYAPVKAEAGTSEADAGRRRYVLEESLWEQVGDGQVHTNVRDLARWLENFHTGAVGGKELTARMQIPGKLRSGESLTYASGLMLGEYRGLPTVWHGGFWMGYIVRLMMFPQQHFAAVALCNRNDARPSEYIYGYADKYLDKLVHGPRPPIVLPSEPPEPPAQWAPESLSAYVGRYYSDEADAHCVVWTQSGQLRIDSCASSVLTPGAPGEFRAPHTDFTFRFAPAGATATSAAAVEFSSDGVRRLTFRRAP